MPFNQSEEKIVSLANLNLFHHKESIHAYYLIFPILGGRSLDFVEEEIEKMPDLLSLIVERHNSQGKLMQGTPYQFLLYTDDNYIKNHKGETFLSMMRRVLLSLPNGVEIERQQRETWFRDWDEQAHIADLKENFDRVALAFDKSSAVTDYEIANDAELQSKIKSFRTYLLNIKTPENCIRHLWDHAANYYDYEKFLEFGGNENDGCDIVLVRDQDEHHKGSSNNHLYLHLNTSHGEYDLELYFKYNGKIFNLPYAELSSFTHQLMQKFYQTGLLSSCIGSGRFYQDVLKITSKHCNIGGLGSPKVKLFCEKILGLIDWCLPGWNMQILSQGFKDALQTDAPLTRADIDHYYLSRKNFLTGSASAKPNKLVIGDSAFMDLFGRGPCSDPGGMRMRALAKTYGFKFSAICKQKE